MCRPRFFLAKDRHRYSQMGCSEAEHRQRLNPSVSIRVYPRLIKRMPCLSDMDIVIPIHAQGLYGSPLLA
jgi:hypothetical protein